jgi:hypothetical protein
MKRIDIDREILRLEKDIRRKTAEKKKRGRYSFYDEESAATMVLMAMKLKVCRGRENAEKDGGC